VSLEVPSTDPAVFDHASAGAPHALSANVNADATVTSRLLLTDGRTLYNRFSFGSGSIDDPDLFKRILRDQMEVTAAQLRAAVDDGIAPHRPGAAESRRLPGPYLDHALVKALLRAGCTAADIAALIKAEAVDLLEHLRN